MKMDTNVMNFIKPELLIIIPVLYFIGMMIKGTQHIKDNYIPLIIGAVSVILAILWTGATSSITSYKDAFTGLFTAFTQGVLCAGCSVYINQIFKQANKD